MIRTSGLRLPALLLGPALAAAALLAAPGASAAPRASLHDASVGALPKAPAARPRRAPQDRVDPAAVDAAIRRAIDFLLARQELDGSWRPTDAAYVPGQTALAAYALLKCGLRADHPAVDRALRFLRAHPPQRTYGLAVAVQAFDAAGVEDSDARIAEYAQRLLDAKGQGFSYPGAHEDLSLTQYGCLALRIAERRGFEIKRRVWEAAGDFTERLAKEDGAFSYLKERPGTSSMTAAGIVTLLVVREALDAQDALGRQDAERIDARIDAAIEWLDERFDPTRNVVPPTPDGYHAIAFHRYALYGLERIAGLAGRDVFPNRSWYDQCARALLDSQGDRGQWSNAYGFAHEDTCFGILVLKRATATSTESALLSLTYGDDDPERDVSLRASGDVPLTLWLSSFGGEARALEWPADSGKGPRIVRVEYVEASTGEVVATVEGDPDVPWDGGKHAARLAFDRPGVRRIVARVHLRPPGAPRTEHRTLTSQELAVSIRAVMTAGERRALEDAGRSALAGSKIKVRVSSTHKGHPAGRLVDGFGALGWLCAKDDAEPWIELDLRRPGRGHTLALTPYTSARDEPTTWGRPARVRVLVNGREVGVFDLPERPEQKLYVELGKRARVRKVRIEVLAKHLGTGHPNKCGFAEIELIDDE